jgi:subtilisin family serine protease
VVQRYRANPNVLYAEPDFVVRAVNTTPNDPYWNLQWDMTKISAPTAWDTQKFASDVVVAIIDTGIDYTHPDLQGNLYTDANLNHGYTCMNNSCVAGGLDDFGHGTHVAGTIGAVGNNGIGIAGINWGVKLLSIKFLDSNGSAYISDAVLAFNLVTSLKTNSNVNIRLTSNSWGGGGYTQSLKDAMVAAEAAGIVNVCAAGNSGQNADVSPMYPAAYDNRGIISVLASDSNDVGAYFTNYGLASVDIAAPGVSTYSTVPIGTTSTCALCAPSGYKYLSGTSMATLHVSGVLAALLHLYPALTPYQARDEILDPHSYDALTDARAQSTSTGGRLNFAKAINNTAYLNSLPPLNNFPVLTMGPDAFASYPATVSVTASASDADNDPIRKAWGKAAGAGSQWLFGFMLNSVFPDPSGDSVSFTAPGLARTATVPYDASVADGRGGGAHGRSYVTVTPGGNPGASPSGTLSLSPPDSVSVGSTVTVIFPVTDPDAGLLYWDLWASGHGGASGWCCFTGSSTSLTFNSAGVYRVAAQAIDPQLNLSTRSTAVISVGDTTGQQPPIAAATLGPLSGPVPLTVNIDMSSSSAPGGGTIQNYFFICGGGGFTAGSVSPQGSCTYTTPGAYWILLEVLDNNGNVDLLSEYVVATPVNNSGDTTPPTLTITNPPNNANVNGTISVRADATDNDGGSGVKQVDFILDTSTKLGTVTSAPYSIRWDTSTAAPGQHTLYAMAMDNAGNSNTSATVTVKVTASDFGISASSSSATISQGQSTKTTVTVSPLNSFSGTVSFSLGGPPPTVLTASFSPTTVTGSGNTTLTLTATAVAAGTYPLQITGTSGSLNHSAPFTLIVNLGGSISVTANPATVTVSRSKSPSGKSTITVTASSGFVGSVTLSASGWPSGATVNLNPSTITVSPGSPKSSTMTMTVTTNTPTGRSTLNVTAQTGEPQAQTKVTLQVNK